MFGLPETLLFAALMGFSIYLSLPLVVRRGTAASTTRLLNAVAIGILIFLVGDVFSDAAGILYNGSLFGYGSSPYYDAVFTVFLTVGFLVLFYAETSSKAGLSPSQMSLLIALGIGFQNLTEGLVFGSLSVQMGLTGPALVVLVGFILQNATEGFPIASPFLGRSEWRLKVLLALLFIGGLPTILGAAVGYYYSSDVFSLAFDGLAIGSMLYVILPMFRHAFLDVDSSMKRVTYFGVFLGFLIGFLVNLF
jgi:zinc transporter, ZIP family